MPRQQRHNVTRAHIIMHAITDECHLRDTLIMRKKLKETSRPERWWWRGVETRVGDEEGDEVLEPPFSEFPETGISISRSLSLSLGPIGLSFQLLKFIDRSFSFCPGASLQNQNELIDIDPS